MVQYRWQSMNKKFTLIFAIGLLVLLSGCYTPPPVQTEISVMMSGNSFQPASWRVPASALVTLHLTNQDPVAHEWVILFRQAAVPFSSGDLSSIFWSYSIPAGKSETVQFKAPAAAGNYEVVSRDALADGMAGKLTVVRLDEIQK